MMPRETSRLSPHLFMSACIGLLALAVQVIMNAFEERVDVSHAVWRNTARETLRENIATELQSAPILELRISRRFRKTILRDYTLDLVSFEDCTALSDVDKFATLNDWYGSTNNLHAQWRVQISSGIPFRFANCSYIYGVRNRLPAFETDGLVLSSTLQNIYPTIKSRVIPLDIHPVATIANFIFYTTLVLLIILAINRSITKYRKQNSRCVRCLYDITGLKQCPECGVIR